ncbi:DUF4136 domain-containing protein [Aureitalea marina]|uniref:DUF4136 domain-containing protein n=1 Tax=Aureitalea marina TaxID=930804 RepID=A0A2S7KR32_9FLAO|nr:DUF4136 domain-containing protein [Aureitalea marina]PQB05023.1 hypothetical protein BST85_09055 [Aureitalea marina]
MKKVLLLLAVIALTMTSCSSVRVVTDYDKEAPFGQYQTYAFYKPGIDQAKISDLDKKRILRNIDAQLTSKGMIKSEKADLLVSIFTQERDRVDVYNNAGWGWGWGYPYGWGGYWGGYWGPTVTTSTEGTLYIDLIDAKTNQLVWQGIGTGDLVMRSMEKREQRIQEMVTRILQGYPPGASSK